MTKFKKSFLDIIILSVREFELKLVQGSGLYTEFCEYFDNI